MCAAKDRRCAWFGFDVPPPPSTVMRIAFARGLTVGVHVAGRPLLTFLAPVAITRILVSADLVAKWC